MARLPNTCSCFLQAQREYPGNLAECKDKFLVQWVKVDNDVKDVLPDAFDAGKNKEIKQSKLRVTLVRALRSWEGCSLAVANMLHRQTKQLHWSPLMAGQ